MVTPVSTGMKLMEEDKLENHDLMNTVLAAQYARKRPLFWAKGFCSLMVFGGFGLCLMGLYGFGFVLFISALVVFMILEKW